MKKWRKRMKQKKKSLIETINRLNKRWRKKLNPILKRKAKTAMRKMKMWEMWEIISNKAKQKKTRMGKKIIIIRKYLKGISLNH